MKEYPVNLLRFNEYIRLLMSKPVEKGGILLYGSSFFTRWEHAAEEMLKASEGRYHVVNRGFGGATADELIYHYARLVPACAPKAVIFRMGPNDFFHGFSAEEAWSSAWRLASFFRADYPDVKLIFLCAFDYRSLKPELYPRFKEFNALQKEYAESTDNVWYMDINEFFHERAEDAGTLENFRDVFVEDGLHLKPEAYLEFADYLTARLDEMKIF